MDIDNALKTMNNFDQAMQDLNRAIKLNPKSANAYVIRGRMYGQQNNDKLAIKDFEQAISIQPQNAEAYGNRGIAYLKQGNNSLGCPDAQKSCALGKCELLEMAKGKGDCR